MFTAIFVVFFAFELGFLISGTETWRETDAHFLGLIVILNYMLANAERRIGELYERMGS